MSTHPASVHAYTDDALGDLDAVGLAEALRAGSVSSAEVIDAAIARIEAVNPHLSALVVDDFDRARRARPADGFFAGVPTVVKDNCDVAGLPTQQGSAAYRGRAKRRDGDWASRFFATGLVGLGKSQLSEFGFNASAEFPDRPPVRNPWSLAHTSGASSAGSAALVASGALPIAHANDGGGSIRIPAACCGLVGLKPSLGRTLGDALTRKIPVPLVCDGVVTRSVRDTAAFLREYERVRPSRHLPPIGDITRPGQERLRVALMLHSPEGPSDADTVAAVRAAGALLESLGHHVEEVEPPVPASFPDDFLTYWSLLSAMELATGRVTLDPSFRASRTDNLSRGLARDAVRHARAIPGAIARLRDAARVSAEFSESWDLLVSPTLGAVTPEIGRLSPAQPYEVVVERLREWVRFTPFANASGDPAVSLPLGRDSRGLPIGIQVSAGIGQEARLLQVAFELEEAQPFARIQDRVLQP